LAENGELPLGNDISASILDPIEIQQQLQLSPHQPSAILSFTNTSSDPSRSAPKKKFLERTISQTDAEQQKQELASDFNSNLSQNIIFSFFFNFSNISRPMQEFNFPRDLTDKVHVHTNFKLFNFFSKNVNFF